jgi:hypothetical protein
MLAKLHTFSLLGIDVLPVVAEVDVSPSALAKTVLVGLPEQAVKESIHRIERALLNSGSQRSSTSVEARSRRPGIKTHSDSLVATPCLDLTLRLQA